jgi:hypothetical protein
VEVTLRADLEIRLKIGIPDRFAALRALGPEALGPDLMIGRRDDFMGIALEPGHRSLLGRLEGPPEIVTPPAAPGWAARWLVS